MYFYGCVRERLVFGLEALVARELIDLGFFEQKVENSRGIIYGDEDAVCTVNMQLRITDRALVIG